MLVVKKIKTFIVKELWSVSQSVIKQIGAAPIFTRCGRATLTPVLEYLVTEPPLKSDGTPQELWSLVFEVNQ
jgi:hypothetical protein